MPTAVEYGLTNPSHTQGGIAHAAFGYQCAPQEHVLQLLAAQGGVAHAAFGYTARQEHILPGTNSGDGQLAGVFVVPLLLVAVAVAVRRRMAHRC